MSNPNNFKSSGGFDANNQVISNIADAVSLQDALNLRSFAEKNTVPKYALDRTYPVDFIVEYSGQLWKCVSPVTVVGGEFDKTKWSALYGQDKWLRITAPYTAASMDSLLVDTTTAAVTITLPVVATSGDYLLIQDAGNAGSFNITINRNGHTINGAASNVVINESNTNASLVYLNGTWVLNTIRIPRIKTVSGAATLLANHTYAIDASSAFTVALPANPKSGDWVELIDRLGTFGTHSIILSGNSKQIDGQATAALAQRKGMWIASYNGSVWSLSAYYGNSLQADKNLSELTDKAAARTALLLGSLATMNTGTAGGEVRTNTQNEAVFQAKDATLTALAALVTAADKLIYSTGPDAFAQTDLPSQARTLLAATSQALQQAAMGLGTAATKNVGTAANDVMGVGAFGLGGESITTTDPNTITKSGWYTCPAGVSNGPSASYLSTILHNEHNASYTAATQIAVNSNSAAYVRVRSSGGVWGAWGEISSGSLGTAAYKNFGTSPGNLIEVGAFGESGGAPLVVTDVNSIAVSGTYITLNSGDVGIPTSNTNYVYQHIQTGNGQQAHQLAFRASAGLASTYRRFRDIGGVWGAWVEIYSTSNTGTAVTKNFGTSAGNLMEVGAFGLGVDIPTTTITDCNTATKNGWYIVSDTATNRPVMGANPSGMFVITDGVTTRRTQFLTDAISGIGTGPKIWVRQYDGSAWSAWTKLVFFDNIAPNWVNVTYTNGWTDFSTSYDSFGYRLEGNRVHFRGVVKNAATGGTSMATIPAGYRPTKTKMFSVITGNNVATGLTVNQSGLVSLFAYATAGASVPLDGISYEID